MFLLCSIVLLEKLAMSYYPPPNGFAMPSQQAPPFGGATYDPYSGSPYSQVENLFTCCMSVTLHWEALQ